MIITVTPDEAMQQTALDTFSPDGSFPDYDLEAWLPLLNSWLMHNPKQFKASRQILIDGLRQQTPERIASFIEDLHGQCVALKYPEDGGAVEAVFMTLLRCGRTNQDYANGLEGVLRAIRDMNQELQERRDEVLRLRALLGEKS